MSLSGRVALITGAGRGIGAATARRLAEAGADIALSDLNRPAAEEVAASLKATGRRIMPVVADVTDLESVRGMVAQVVESLGGLDILVNNVGGGGATRTFEETTLEVWESTIALNMRSTFLCTKEAVPHMKGRGWGRIVNLASVAGRSRAMTGGPQYSAAKAGVIGFTRHVAVELAPFGITVNAVAPGLTATARIRAKVAGMPEETRAQVVGGIPVGRWGEPEDIAAAVAFLCSEEAGYICGAVLDVNGGVFVG